MPVTGALNMVSIVDFNGTYAPSITESPMAVTVVTGVPGAVVGVPPGGAVGVVVVALATVVVGAMVSPGLTTISVRGPNDAGVAALPPLPSPTTMITRPTTTPA